MKQFVLATLFLFGAADFRVECSRIQSRLACESAGCRWYDLSQIPFGGGEKGCIEK